MIPDHWKQPLERLALARGWPTTPAALADGVAELSRSYNLHQRAPTFTPAVQAARLLYFFPRDIAKSHAAVQELLPSLPSRPLRILDLGCGLGATSLGAILALRERGFDAPIEVTAVDTEPTSLGLLPSLWSLVKNASVSPQTADATLANFDGPWDLILLGQVLCELEPWLTGEERANKHAAWLSQHLDRLTPEGSLLLIEPALRGPTRHLHAVRDRLIALGRPVFAPCPHQGTCPMLRRETDWCHEHRATDLPDWLQPVSKLAGLHWEGLTFAYLILKKDGSTFSLRHRVVSEPLVSKGRKDYVLCGTFDGEPDARKIGRLDRHATEANQGWDTLQRGDRLIWEPISNRIEPTTCIQGQPPC